MDFKIDRRSALKAGAALAAAYALPARAQAKPTLRFAAVFSDKDIRAGMIQMFAKEVEGDFKVEPFYNGTLFKQGTELVALQRDNLEMGNIAPQDISKQIPAWSILTSAYLFRDANHLNAFFASDLGAQMKKMVEDQTKIKILGPTFFGTRQVGLKPKKKINTPADMPGVKLKTWQSMSPAKQKAFQAAADKAIAWSAAEHLKREAELADGFRKQGLEVYAPNVNAFRAYAQKTYLGSDEAKDWPKGMLEKINALK